MIKTKEGTRNKGWQTKWPVASLGVVIIACLVGIGSFAFQEFQTWTPLQRWYWYEYLSTHDFPTDRGDYLVIMKTDGHGRHSIATDADVVPDTSGRQYVPFQLTSNARQRGAVQLVIDTVHYSSTEMNKILA